MIDIPHWACGKINCDCDERTMEAMDNMQRDEDDIEYQTEIERDMNHAD